MISKPSYSVLHFLQCNDVKPLAHSIDLPPYPPTPQPSRLNSHAYTSCSPFTARNASRAGTLDVEKGLRRRQV